MPSVISERKIVSISSKRQITIPQKYYNSLGFGSEAEIMLRGSEIVLKPVRQQSDDYFSEEILSELISEGYSGKPLLDEFRVRKSKVRPAVEKMLSDADAAAKGYGDYETMDEVFLEV